MKMPRSFLFCSAVFFFGGLFLLLFNEDLAFILGLILALMGGIPLLISWFKDLFLLLPDEWKTTNTSDDSKKEDTSDENP